jgi:prephenate dehydrogenase
VKQLDTIAIIGVGLIGGSVGMAVRERKLARRVVGISRRQSTLRTARRRGAIDNGSQNLARGVAGADLIVVCAPVGSIVSLSRQAAQHCGGGPLITDAGSTKAEIVQQLDGGLPDGARFVGSHPMAGSEETGPAHAQADLFENRMVIITPTKRTKPTDSQAIQEFWKALGANVTEMKPVEHDRCVAAISHLPHLAASALAGATNDKDLEIAANGWLDTTRIASGDVDLWMQILETNRPHVLKSLRQFAKLVADLQCALESGDDRKLRKILTDAKRKRDSVK